MKRKVKLKGNLRTYLRWPLFLSFLLVCMCISLFLTDKISGLIASAYVGVYVIVAFLMFYFKRPNVLGDMVQFATEYGRVQQQLVDELSLPYAILDAEGHMLWGNQEFLEVIGNERSAKKSITNVFPELTNEKLPQIEQDSIIHTVFEEKYYKIVMRKMVAAAFQPEETDDKEMASILDSNTLIAIYLFEETEIKVLMKENKDQRIVVGLLYIDNYEEALESIDEVRRSLLIALIDRKINKYMQSIDAIIKKLEKDKYVVIFQHKYLAQLQSTKFSILDEVRAVNIGNEMAVTLSMGLGVNAETYLDGYEYARASIDLALGRGGDQAVIKEGEKILYYGGKSVQVEKSTRVKARVKAHALKELVEAKDKVVIMGHSIGDVDSLGSALGIYRIAKTLNKKAHIVFNDITTSVRPMMNRFINNPEYEEDLFIKSEQAREIVDENTLLVVVDVNRPSYTECEDLLSMTKTIVILDHHRRTGEGIENPVLSYIEPYASSACEMVAEILQYIGEGLRLKQSEADAMYSGIMIDTNNFLTKTGVRTFEAAAYLKRSGADVTKIRKMFRSDMDEFKAKAVSIGDTELFMDVYAIGEYSGEGLESPTVLAAQVANELLNINDIKASFVLTPYNNKIYISARAIDEVNVQVIMEKLGGGGHLNIAGAQLADCTIEEAKDIVKQTLETMTQEGEL